MSSRFFRPLFGPAMAVMVWGLMIVTGMASENFQPVFHPVMDIARATGAIYVDGDLGDAGWQAAASSDNFVERTPGDNSEPPVRTQVMVTYDDNNFYVGFICHDDPSQIRATMCQRDQFNSDDAVIVLLDTYGDASWAYLLYVNPYGIQKDMMWNNITGSDIGFDLVWNSAAKVTSTGYQVEMAVPFAGLRFPNRDAQTWRMDFWRNHPRESPRQYSWTANNRNELCWPCQWGTVNGIADVHPGRGIEILPAAIANQSKFVTDPYDPELPFKSLDVDGEMALGAKYAINSDVTLEATVNPDFSQIEADAAQIDVNSPVALYYPERRPFFQEGRDIFITLFNSFYSRTINDPQLAGKLPGRSGKYRFGFLSAVDDHSFYLVPLEESSVGPFDIGKSYVNIFRGMRSLGSSSQIGMILNDRRYEAGGSNTIFGLDQRIRLSPTYFIDGQYLMTYTKESDDSELYGSQRLFADGKYTRGFDGESFTGFGLISRFNRNARHWSFQLDYNQVDWTYRTQVGYDPWVDYRNLNFYTQYVIYYDRGLLDRMWPSFSADSRWNYEGERKWSHVNLGWSTALRFAQTNASVVLSTGDETWSGVRFRDLWRIHFDAFSQFSNKLGGYFNAEVGNGPALNVLEKGRELSFQASLNLKPIDRVIIEPYFSYLKSDDLKTDREFFENYVARARLGFQLTKSLSVRLVVQHTYREVAIPISEDPSAEYAYYLQKNWSIDPLVTFRISPFSVFYAGVTYDFEKLPADLYPFYSPEPNPSLAQNWNMASRKFFMKIQYLFQV